MLAKDEHAGLLKLIAWIDEKTAGLSFKTDERTMIALGCFDVALEHQAAFAVLVQSELYGSAFALLRVISESLVRGLWLYSCAVDGELQKFKKGKLNKTFAQLISEYEATIGTPAGVLSNFKATAWDALNGFTHTGFHQVSRRHAPGKVGSNYPAPEIEKAVGVAGALGLIAAGQLMAIAGKDALVVELMDLMQQYAAE